MRYILFFIITTVVIFAKLSLSVSIPPQEYIVKEIAKDRVDILTVVTPGNSPHTYEPKPSQMVKLSNSKLYFAIGVEFEDAWLPKFKSQNSNLKIIHCDKDIKKLKISHDSKIENEPHIWLNINNLKKISKATLDALVSEDSNNSSFYIDNYKEFIKRVESLDSEIKSNLRDIKNREFLIFHPSWGYFAKEYNLKQIAIEAEGKEPTPKELIKVLKLAKEYKVKAIFVQPEFSQKSANLIAKELGIKVIEVSPLKIDILENIQEFTKNLLGE